MSNNRKISVNLSESSIRTYSSSCTRLITYLLDRKPQLINEQYKNELNKYTSLPEQRDYIKKSIFCYDGIPPLNFSLFCAQDFCDWIKTLKKPNGGYYTVSSYTDHRSAIQHCYRVNGIALSPSFEKDVRHFYATFFVGKSPSPGSRKSSGGGGGISSAGSSLGKRKWNQGDINVSSNSVSTSSSIVQPSSSQLASPLLTKRIAKPSNTINQTNHQSNSTNKEKKRIAVKLFLKKVQDFLRDEKYESFGIYLTKYHQALSGDLSGTAKENQASSSEVINTLKTQVLQLLQDNKDLYSLFETFLPTAYR